MLWLPQPPGAKAEGSAGLPVAQGQSWESMSAWAGCRLSDALGDGKSGFGRTRSRLLFILGQARASAKPPPLAACARLSSAPAPGTADSLPGRRGRTWGSHVPPPRGAGGSREGCLGDHRSLLRCWEGCRERPALITRMAPALGALLRSQGPGAEGVHPGRPPQPSPLPQSICQAPRCLGGGCIDPGAATAARNSQPPPARASTVG